MANGNDKVLQRTLSKGIDKDIQEVIKKLNVVKRSFSDEKYKEILAKGADIAKDGIISEAPIGKEPYHLVKDGGSKVKRVKAGNLRKSIQIFSFRNSRAVFAGAVTSKKSRIKKVAGRKLSKRFRAFYWRFVYYGAYNKAPNKFIDRARNKIKSKVLSVLKIETKKALPKLLKNIFDK